MIKTEWSHELINKGEEFLLTIEFDTVKREYRARVESRDDLMKCEEERGMASIETAKRRVWKLYYELTGDAE